MFIRKICLNVFGVVNINCNFVVRCHNRLISSNRHNFTRLSFAHTWLACLSKFSSKKASQIFSSISFRRFLSDFNCFARIPSDSVRSRQAETPWNSVLYFRFFAAAKNLIRSILLVRWTIIGAIKSGFVCLNLRVWLMLF